MTQLPREVFQSVTEFLDAGNTGQVILDVKQGAVCGWRVMKELPPEDGESPDEVQRWAITHHRVATSRRPWVNSGGGPGILQRVR